MGKWLYRTREGVTKDNPWTAEGIQEVVQSDYWASVPHFDLPNLKARAHLSKLAELFTWHNLSASEKTDSSAELETTILELKDDHGPDWYMNKFSWGGAS